MLKSIRSGFKLITLCSLFTAFASQAALLSVPNFSFESPNPPIDQNSPLSITDWSSIGNAGTDPFVNGFTSNPDGTQHMFLQLSQFGGPSINSAMTNSGLIGAAQAGTYTLTVAGGRRNNNATTDGSYIIELFAGTELVAINEIIDPLNTWASGTWNDFSATGSIDFGSEAFGGDLSIKITATSGANNQTQGQFDNVRLEFVHVSSPTMFLLFGLGFVGIAMSRTLKTK